MPLNETIVLGFNSGEFPLPVNPFLDKVIANKILGVIKTLLSKEKEVKDFEYTESKRHYYTEQLLCEILIMLEENIVNLDMEYDDRQKAMGTELSKAARKEWYLRYKDRGMER